MKEKDFVNEENKVLREEVERLRKYQRLCEDQEGEIRRMREVMRETNEREGMYQQNIQELEQNLNPQKVYQDLEELQIHFEQKMEKLNEEKEKVNSEKSKLKDQLEQQKQMTEMVLMKKEQAEELVKAQKNEFLEQLEILENQMQQHTVDQDKVDYYKDLYHKEQQINQELQEELQNTQKNLENLISQENQSENFQTKISEKIQDQKLIFKEIYKLYVKSSRILEKVKEEKDQQNQEIENASLKKLSFQYCQSVLDKLGKIEEFTVSLREEKRNYESQCVRLEEELMGVQEEKRELIREEVELKEYLESVNRTCEEMMGEIQLKDKKGQELEKKLKNQEKINERLKSEFNDKFIKEKESLQEQQLMMTKEIIRLRSILKKSKIFLFDKNLEILIENLVDLEQEVNQTEQLMIEVQADKTNKMIESKSELREEDFPEDHFNMYSSDKEIEKLQMQMEIKEKKAEEIRVKIDAFFQNLKNKIKNYENLEKQIRILRDKQESFSSVQELKRPQSKHQYRMRQSYARINNKPSLNKDYLNFKSKLEALKQKYAQN